jgi:aminoglycoside/choline kinase family phosphotransferase
MILRDFHAENLIWLPGRTGSARVGLLDFQDALMGDPSYDLVSLLQDARRDVPHDLAQAMIRRFTAATGADPDAFLASYCATGAQRQLRILGIFARLSLHFGKVRYVDLIPRVWGHLMTCLQHPDLAAVKTLADGMLPPPTPGNLQILRDKCATIPTP